MCFIFSDFGSVMYILNNIIPPCCKVRKILCISHEKKGGWGGGINILITLLSVLYVDKYNTRYFLFFYRQDDCAIAGHCWHRSDLSSLHGSPGYISAVHQ